MEQTIEKDDFVCFCGVKADKIVIKFKENETKKVAKYRCKLCDRLYTWEMTRKLDKKKEFPTIKGVPTIINKDFDDKKEGVVSVSDTSS